MESGSAKRIVVIKDIPSNLIEEAILILKPRPSDKIAKSKQEVSHKNINNENDYLLKEAELVIDSYINGEKLPREAVREVATKKKNSFHGKFLTNTVINAVLIGSIALLVLLVARMA